jgi:hypothetical protein
MSTLKKYLAEVGRSSLLESSGTKIGSFYIDTNHGDIVIMPIAKTSKGFKVLQSDATSRSGKVAIKFFGAADIVDRGMVKYKPLDDAKHWQVKKIKAHPKYVGESKPTPKFKLTAKLRAVAGQDSLPVLGEGDTVEVDDFVKQLAGVKHSRPGMSEDGEEYVPEWQDYLVKIKY